MISPLKIIKLSLAAFMAALLLVACSQEDVLPPEISATVNGLPVTYQDSAIIIAPGTQVEYSFNINAFAPIQEVYLVLYSVKLFKNPANPTEILTSEPEGNMSYPTGLTYKLSEIVSGTFTFSPPALEKYGIFKVMIVVSDTHNNETRFSFIIKAP